MGGLDEHVTCHDMFRFLTKAHEFLKKILIPISVPVLSRRVGSVKWVLVKKLQASFSDRPLIYINVIPNVYAVNE